jgi:hypothetical protein
VSTKSLIVTVDIDEALKAHNCQASAKHRIQLGNSRLKVRNGLGWDHYCMPCATKIIQRDIEKLQAFQQRLQSISS